MKITKKYFINMLEYQEEFLLIDIIYLINFDLFNFYICYPHRFE